MPPLQGRYPTSAEEAERTAAAIQDLEAPAEPAWIAQRAVTLLSHYFVAEQNIGALKAVAADWQRELKGYPDWAIDAACAWWLSRHNPKRRNKPMPGDISDRANTEAAILTIGRKAVENWKKYGGNPPAFLT